MRPQAGGRPLVAVAAAVIAFIGVLVTRAEPVDPESRLPRRYRLADLIEAEQRETAALRREVAALRADIETERARSAERLGLTTSRREELDEIELQAGLVPLEGAGLQVTLDDSKLDEPPPGGNVNDLVIHSQDVQAVVNALWRAGAEAMSINGQRLVGTSAVLCVGNTLLLNGTVHSPPYVVTAVGATRDRFVADQLVKDLQSAAKVFSLGFAIQRDDDLAVPAYRGSTKLIFAKPR